MAKIINIGSHEKHEVSFDYNTFTGSVKILVDGAVYKTSRVMLVGSTTFLVNIGDKEKHEVRFELDNPLGFAFRGSNLRVFVDNKQSQDYHLSGGGLLLVVGMLLIAILAYVVTFNLL